MTPNKTVGIMSLTLRLLSDLAEDKLAHPDVRAAISEVDKAIKVLVDAVHKHGCTAGHDERPRRAEPEEKR